MSLRVIDLGDGATIALDVVGWALVHAIAGYTAHRTPVRALCHDHGILRLHRSERNGGIYDRLRIRRWKDRLPEAGAFFAGGVNKRHIPLAADGGLERFAVETRRAELAHWWTVAALPVFVLFNPPRALPFLILYAVAANVPCIAVQRYNRARIAAVLARGRHGWRRDAAARRRSSAGTMGSSMP